MVVIIRTVQPSQVALPIVAESEVGGAWPRRGNRLLRVAMVCPYSLSVPGGVQAQVMGLARELRKMGIEVRVLAPCDGPPPDTFVTPLGNSLPTSANGSMAPLAPDASCSLRTMRALGDEQFDVLHLHEPFLPGPTHTAMLLHPAPVVATFHAAGESASYKYLRPIIKPAANNIAHAVAVSKDAADLVRRYIGGSYEILYNGVELDAYRAAPQHPTEGPTIFFCGRHEERKGLDVLLRAFRQLGPEVHLWVGSTGPDTARLHGGVRRRRAHRMARAADRRRQDGSTPRRRCVLRTIAVRRVVRRRVDRGHGRGDADRGQRDRRLPQRRHRRRRCVAGGAGRCRRARRGSATGPRPSQVLPSCCARPEHIGQKIFP